MLRSALLILSGSAATSVMLFARNLMVASLIPVGDYGIAATFALAMAAVEMASTLGLQQQIVQAADGEDPRLQRALQGFQVARGLLAGLVLFLVAGPLAAFLGIPEVAWAYQVLAIVPLLTALQHFDIHRLNRQGRFLPLVLTGALPALASLLLVWPLAAWLQDWRVMLVAILAQHVLATGFSHLSSERPYGVRVDLPLWRRSLRFGWPILLNALVLFAVFQGDKIIVARLLGMEVLGVFAMAVTLTLTPSMILDKTVQTTFLARLSAADGEALTRLARQAVALAVTLGAGLAATGALVAPYLVAPLAGTGFASLPGLLGPLAVMQGLRMCKSGTGVVALSQGFTANAALSNLPRLGALALGWVVLNAGAELTTLIWIAAGAEALGFGLSLGLLGLRARVRGVLSARIAIPALAAFATTAISVIGGAPGWSFVPLVPLAVLGLMWWRDARAG